MYRKKFAIAPISKSMAMPLLMFSLFMVLIFQIYCWVLRVNEVQSSFQLDNGQKYDIPFLPDITKLFLIQQDSAEIKSLIEYSLLNKLLYYNLYIWYAKNCSKIVNVWIIIEFYTKVGTFHLLVVWYFTFALNISFHLLNCEVVPYKIIVLIVLLNIIKVS